MNTASKLRDVSRAAVRAEIAEAADDLFAAHGFDATTVDQIAEAVGMSQRTFFRYFPSKEDAALDSFAQQSDLFLDRLTARPPGEDAWDSLRRVFDVVVDQCADASLAERLTALHRLLGSSPTLLAAYLERSMALQVRLVEALRDRDPARAQSDEVDDAVLQAVVGSAFACLEASITRLTEEPSTAPDLAGRLDRIMAALRPALSPGAP